MPETVADDRVGQQIVERGEAAKAAAEEARQTQESKSRKVPRRKRSHDDKLG